jgi:hypothetical protein
VAKGKGGSSSSGKGSRYRSAKTGRFVTKSYAKTHRSTTVKEKRK